MIEYIGKNNEKIKLAARLASSARSRREHSLFLLEGLRLCRDAAQTGIKPEITFVTERFYSEHGGEAAAIISESREIFYISEPVSERISDTKNPQGIFCVCKTLDKSDNIDKIKYNGIYVALENIATPDNLGAAARTAEALGIDGLIVSGGCDIYNPKALRASMGALLRLDVHFCAELSSAIAFCRKNGMKTYAAVPDSDALPITQIKRGGGIICAVGNEASGLTRETVDACGESVTIPMRGRAQSLNAAAAAAIIMWELIG